MVQDVLYETSKIIVAVNYNLKSFECLSRRVNK